MKQNTQEKKRLIKINKTLYPKKRANNPDKNKDNLKKELGGKIEEQPRIREKALELIAKTMGDLETGTNLISFLKDCGVDDSLVECPQTKWRMVYSVFTKLSVSTNPEDYKTLFKIIEEAAHPLMHGGDIEKSLETTDKFNSYLQHDGFCFQNGKIIKSTPEILREIRVRIEKRKKEQISQTIDSEPMPTKEPLHIVIDEVRDDIGIKEVEEKFVLQKTKNKKIQLRKFPSDLKWEEISIQFLNEHEVIIKARNETLQSTYELMGFQDEKKKLPNKQWQFLRLLALKRGEISWENNQNLPIKQINSIKKQKQLLSETLKVYFQISDSEPFADYKKEKAYRIKITITPEPELEDIDEQEVYDE